MACNKKIFVAGATGVIGRTLCKLLVNDGWKVFGTTRSENKIELLKELGVEPNIIHIPTEFIIKYAPQFEGPLLGDKMWSAIFDNSKIKKLAPNFDPKTRYEDIAPIQIKRILENVELQSIDHSHNELMDKIISEYKRLLKNK